MVVHQIAVSSPFLLSCTTHFENPHHLFILLESGSTKNFTNWSRTGLRYHMLSLDGKITNIQQFFAVFLSSSAFSHPRAPTLCPDAVVVGGVLAAELDYVAAVSRSFTACSTASAWYGILPPIGTVLHLWVLSHLSQLVACLPWNDPHLAARWSPRFWAKHMAHSSDRRYFSTKSEAIAGLLGCTHEVFLFFSFKVTLFLCDSQWCPKSLLCNMD